MLFLLERTNKLFGILLHGDLSPQLFIENLLAWIQGYLFCTLGCNTLLQFVSQIGFVAYL